MEMAFPPKEQESLRILNLEGKNIGLLSKWLFKLLSEDGYGETSRVDSTWAKRISSSYTKNRGFTLLGLSDSNEEEFLPLQIFLK
jgi:hypothetical protein